MKLCIITQENAREPKTWSGTPKTIIEYCEKQSIEICNLSFIGKIHHFGFGKIKAIIDKYIYCYSSSFRDPFPLWYAMNANFFENEMAKYKVDGYIFMGEQCLKDKANINGKTYVYMDRMINIIAQYDEDKRKCKNWYIKNYMKNDKKSLSCMDHIFTQNDWSRNEIISKYGIPESKVTNIGVGVNLQGYEGIKQYDNHKILIVLRKGTEHYKGLDFLLEAFIIARKAIPDLSLHVVGTEYKKMDGVFYYYNQPRTVTVSLFQECALYAMPALLEPNGITYLEALANKMPILGLNRFAFPEFSGYGKFGFIVDEPIPENVSIAICKAFSDTEKLHIMGNEGQKMVLKKYTWDKVISSMLQIIETDLRT